MNINDKASNKEKACIAIMIEKLGLKSQKAALVAGFTNGREESSAKMYSDEARALIAYLKSNDPDEISADKMRRKIISMAHEIGWRLSGTMNVNMGKVNSWCIVYGKYHKALDKHTVKELPVLLTQFETMYLSFIKGL